MRIDGELLEKLVNEVVLNRVEVDISVTPDSMEIRVLPWKPYQPSCPYGVERGDQDV